MNNERANALRIEWAVLGCLLHDNTGLDDVGDFLLSGDFSIPFHCEIYQAIVLLVSENKNADILSVSDYLKNKNNEKTDDIFIQLCEIAQSCYSPSSIKLYADILKQDAIDRGLLKVGQDIIASVHQKKEHRLDYAQQSISQLADALPSEINSASLILTDVLAAIDERRANKGGIIGVPTGFCDLDKILHGLQGGDLIVLAGRPAMGKTLLALNIAEHVAIVRGRPVAFFSLEMSKHELVERSLVSVAQLNAEAVKTGMLSAEDLVKISCAVSGFSEAKLFIEDQTSVGVSEIRSKCRRIKRQHGLALIVVDYITLMSGVGENETVRIGNISRGLKLLARDLNVPLIAISQLNRSVDQRNNKKPTMSDIRQSGAVEQDADLILFVYREEEYNKSIENKGLAEVIVAKHRKGKTGTVYLSFNGDQCRFDNRSDDRSIGMERQYQHQRAQFKY